MKSQTILEKNPDRSLTIGVTGYLTRKRAILVLSGLLVGLCLMSLLSLAMGSEHVSAERIMEAGVAKLTGGVTSLTPEEEVIIFSLRLPRIILAIGVGAALATAGAAFQSLLRNPLADPYILGVSGGAAVGSIVAIMFAGGLVLSRPIFGFAGALVSSLAVYRLGRRTNDPSHLVLAGVVISTLLSSVIVLLTSLTDNIRLRNITLWLLGDLSGGTPEGLTFILISTIAGTIVLITRSRALNLMMIGERDAFALGVETARVRWIVYLTASMLTGAAVSAGGAIGYVGLVVPHLIRLAAGADNRLVIAASAMGGSILILIADTIARTAISPRELPTGAITALIGAPVFIYLLIRGRKQ